MSRPFRIALFAAGLLVGLASPARAQSTRGDEVTALLFAPDGKTLYVATGAGALSFWDVDRDKARFGTQAHGGIFGLALSPDGRILATSGKDGSVRLWDVVRAKELRTFKGHAGTVAAVAFSPDGKTLASAGYDRTVRLWQADTGKARSVLHGHEGKVTAVAFAPDGKALASAGIASADVPGIQGLSQGDQVHLWDLAKDEPPRRIGLRGDKVMFSPDDRFLVATGILSENTRTPNGINLAGGPRTVVWDLRRDKERFRLTEHGLGLDLTADGRFLATGWGTSLHYSSYLSGKSQCVGLHVWEMSTGQEVWRLELAKEQATVLAFAPDGKRLASGQANGNFRVHELTPKGWHAPKKLTARELDRAWEDLAGKPAVAYAALWTLAAAEGQAVDFLKGRLKPLSRAKLDVSRLLADLDSLQFKVRDKAFRELATLGDQIEPALEKALKDDKTSLEARRRLEKLLAQASTIPAPERLREDRALAVLERVATPPALALLRTLASGPRTAMAEQAQAALRWLERRFGKE